MKVSCVASASSSLHSMQDRFDDDDRARFLFRLCLHRFKGNLVCVSPSVCTPNFGFGPLLKSSSDGIDVSCTGEPILGGFRDRFRVRFKERRRPKRKNFPLSWEKWGGYWWA